MNPLALFVPVQKLITAPQDLTASWVDLGGEIDVRAIETLDLWLNVDINGSSDIRVRLLAKHTAAHADEFTWPFVTASTANVTIAPEYTELDSDLDQILLLSSTLFGVMDKAQIQVQAGTLGAPAGQVDAARITLVFK